MEFRSTLPMVVIVVVSLAGAGLNVQAAETTTNYSNYNSYYANASCDAGCDAAAASCGCEATAAPACGCEAVPSCGAAASCCKAKKCGGLLGKLLGCFEVASGQGDFGL